MVSAGSAGSVKLTTSVSTPSSGRRRKRAIENDLKKKVAKGIRTAVGKILGDDDATKSQATYNVENFSFEERYIKWVCVLYCKRSI